MFCEKGVLKNFAIFKGKCLCWSLKTWVFSEKWLQHSFFPLNIAKSLRKPILEDICKRLLLLWDHVLFVWSIMKKFCLFEEGINNTISNTALFVNVTVGLVLKNVYLNHKYCYKSVFGLFGTLSIFCYFYAFIFLNKANKWSKVVPWS